MEEVRREEDQQHQLSQVLLPMHLQGQHELPGDEAGAAEGPQRPAIVRGHLLQRTHVQQRLPPALPLRVPAADLVGEGRLHLLRLVRAARTFPRGQCRRLAFLQRHGGGGGGGAARHAAGGQEAAAGARAAAVGDVPVGRRRRGAEAGVLQHRVPRRLLGRRRRGPGRGGRCGQIRVHQVLPFFVNWLVVGGRKAIDFYFQETNMILQDVFLNPVSRCPRGQEYQRSACYCDFVSSIEGNTRANLDYRVRFSVLCLLWM